MGHAACDQLPSFFWNLSLALHLPTCYGFERLNTKDIRDKKCRFDDKRESIKDGDECKNCEDIKQGI